MKHHTSKYTYLERNADDALLPGGQWMSDDALALTPGELRDSLVDHMQRLIDLSGEYASTVAAEGVAHLAAANAAERRMAAESANDIVLEVDPKLDTGPNAVVSRYEQVERRARAHWTPERLAEKESKEAKDRAALAAHYETLHGVVALDDLLDWFVKLEELSFTHAALTKDQRGDVESLCAMFGVTPGMNCTPEEFKPTNTERALLARGPYLVRRLLAPRAEVEGWLRELAELVKAKTDAGVKWFERQPRDFKMRWLLGQALDGTLRVGCPHQIIHKFAAEFKALPRDAAPVTEDKSGQ